jgi:hypothetical protein
VLLAYVIIDDPSSLLWVAGLLAVGFVLYLAEYISKKRHGARVGLPDADDMDDMEV